MARQRHARVAGLPEQPPELPGRLIQDELPAGEEARVIVRRGVERDVGDVVHEASLDDDGEQQEPPGQADLPEPPPLPEGVQPLRDELARYPPALSSEPDLDEHPQERRSAEEGEEEEIPPRRDLYRPSFLLRARLDPGPDHAPQHGRRRPAGPAGHSEQPVVADATPEESEEARVALAEAFGHAAQVERLPRNRAEQREEGAEERQEEDDRHEVGGARASPARVPACAVAEQIPREEPRVRDQQRRADRTTDEQHGDVDQAPELAREFGHESAGKRRPPLGRAPLAELLPRALFE